MRTVKYYKLEKEKNEFILKLLDENKEEIKNYDNLENNEINFLIKESFNNDFTNLWNENIENEDDEKIKLNSELIEILLKNENFVDENFEKIKSKSVEKLFLIVSEDERDPNKLNTSLEIEENIAKVEIINQDYLYVNSCIYKIDVVKNEFYEISDLVTTIEKYEVEGFLTLVLKNYNNLEIRYEDYSTEYLNIKESTPQLIIEKISLDNSLFLKINSIISTMDYSFFIEHDIKKIAIINELEKKLEISNINLNELTENTEDIVKRLNKLQKNIVVKSAYYLDEDNFLILQEELAKEFVKRELLQLTSKYNIIGTDKLKKYNIKAVKPKIVGKFSYGLDYLEGEIDIEIDGEKFTIQQLLNSYKKDSYIVLSNGTNALINKKYIEKLQRIFKENKGNKVKISFFDLPIVNSLIEDKLFNAQNINKSFFEGINNIETYAERIPKLNANLRDYQKYGYRWLYYLVENRLGCCLADDMGLGKTLQAIALLSRMHEEKNKKSLIIMPKSLIYNWENEIKKFAPHLNISVYYGTNRNFKETKKSEIILTTYGTIRNDIEEISKKKFDLIILDESQNIKNISSQTTKSILLLNSKNRIALSGTPIENNLLELYSLFRFLNPAMFGTLQEFNDYYVSPIQKYGDHESIEELRKKIYPFILRRVKKEVLKDLPEKIEKIVYVDMNSQHRKIYEERRKYYYETLNKNITKDGFEKNKFFILQALNELRHITSAPEHLSKAVTSSKKEVLIENIKEAIENKHKVLVFANYISSIESICKILEENKIKYLKMTGKTKERQELVDKFQNDKRYKVFVMTLKTGGIGLNLTSADTIFIYDPWWNKTAENQAIDRAYRLGQDKTVFSYKLIMKNSIEEKILKLQEIKNKLLEDLISEDNISTKNLTKSDIEFILGS